MESNFTLVGVVRAAESLEKRRAGFCTRGLKEHVKSTGSRRPDGRRRRGALDLANLPIKLPNVIFAIVAPVAGLPFVAGRGIVILLLDLGVPAHGLEIVPP
jgi:hypothetical protein